MQWHVKKENLEDQRRQLKTRERAISKKGYERKIGRKTKVPVMRWDNGKIVTKSERKQMGLKN